MPFLPLTIKGRIRELVIRSEKERKYFTGTAVLGKDKRFLALTFEPNDEALDPWYMHCDVSIYRERCGNLLRHLWAGNQDEQFKPIIDRYDFLRRLSTIDGRSKVQGILCQRDVAQR